MEGRGEDPFASGVAGLRDSRTLSTGAGEALRGVTRAGVLARLGLALGVEGPGLALAEPDRGDCAGLADEVLPLVALGDAALWGKGLASLLIFMAGMDCLFFKTLSLASALFSSSFSRSLSFFSFFRLSCGVESLRGVRWAMSGVLVVTLQRSEQRWCGR